MRERQQAAGNTFTCNVRQTSYLEEEGEGYRSWLRLIRELVFFYMEERGEVLISSHPAISSEPQHMQWSVSCYL